METKIIDSLLTGIQGQLRDVLSELAHIIRLQHDVMALWAVSIVLFAAMWAVSEWRMRVLKRYIDVVRQKVEELEKAA